MGIDNLYSAYPDLAGKTLDWLPMDKQELFRYNLSNKKVAIEHNGIIVARINYKTKFLKSNDKVELVTFIGGG